MRVTQFLRAHVVPALQQVRGAVAIAVLLLFVSAASYVASVEAMREVVEVLRLGSVDETLSPILRILRDGGLRSRRSLFLAINATALLLPLMTYVFIFLRDVAFEIVSVRIAQVLREQVFERILRLPYAQLVAADPGVLVKRVAYDAGNVRMLIIEGGLRRIADITIAVALVAYLFKLDVRLAAVTVGVLLVYFVGAFWSAGLARATLAAIDRRLDAVVRGAQGAFARAMDIRANSREGTEIASFAKLVAADADENIRGSRVLMIDRSFTGFLAAIGPVTVTLVGGLFVLGHTLTLETLLAFAAATSMLYGPVNDLSALPIIHQRSAVAIDNVGALLATPVEGAGEAPGETLERADTVGISVRGLRFAYPGSKRVVKIDSLDIAAGERVAIVGRSGAGKSTLLRILFRLLDDYEGVVEVNGVDVRKWSRDSLRRNIAWMTQEAQLFAGTIRDNIAYGAWQHDTVDDGQLWSAAEQARIDADVRAMSEQLDTQLAVGAANISGGQRGRITLARALVKRPGLLLLDEPLTGVAPKDRREVVAALSRGGVACTVLVVTHQHDLLEHMDRVIWMDVDNAADEHGMIATRIRAVGAHDALLADPAYRATFGDNDRSEGRSVE